MDQQEVALWLVLPLLCDWTCTYSKPCIYLKELQRGVCTPQWPVLGWAEAGRLIQVSLMSDRGPEHVGPLLSQEH